MSKHRLEAFSDGVFAIVITLLILGIRVPEGQPANLGIALSRMLPQVFTYVLSFFVVGLYWFAHHRVGHQVRQINGTFIWLNLVWLLTVSVMPFPAALLAGYPLQPIPIAVYGVDLILANVTGFIIIVYLRRHPELCVAPISRAALRGQAAVYAFTNGMYLVAIGLAWVSPWVSYGMYALLLVWVMIRYARISNPFEPRHAAGQATSLMILIAGPYRSGTNDDPEKMTANVRAMEAAALPVFRAGHIPVLGEWLALPMLKPAGSHVVGDAGFKEVFHPIAERLVSHCDGVLRIGGPSAGADHMVELARARGLAVYHRLDEIPGCG